jgi:Flp pilus assembly protein TadG
MNVVGPRKQRGQIIVLFALSLVAILAMVGLVLDGGSAFAQRRSEQNAVDLSALAAANDLIVNQGSADWLGTARRVAEENGYKHGENGIVVDATCRNCPGQTLDDAYDGVQVTVSITAPHPNNFASVVGMSSWNVGATATAKTGWPNTATGAGPFIVSKKAFDTGGHPIKCTGEKDECDLEHPISDTPKAATEFAWTDFGYDKECHEPGNVNDRNLTDYLAGRADFSVTLEFGCYIAQHNDGVMNNIVAALNRLAPMEFPVPVVDDSGNYAGWVTFMLTGATTGGRNGFLTGYFLSDNHQTAQLNVTGAGFGTSTFGGTYEIKLIN